MQFVYMNLSIYVGMLYIVIGIGICQVQLFNVQLFASVMGKITVVIRTGLPLAFRCGEIVLIAK